jgi:hypothetical protein
VRFRVHGLDAERHFVHPAATIPSAMLRDIEDVVMHAYQGTGLPAFTMAWQSARVFA